MSKKLTIITFFISSLVVISWAAGVVAEEEAHENREARIKQVQDQIKDLECALERESNQEEAAKLKEKLQEHRKKLDILMDETPESEKPEGEFAEIRAAIQDVEATMEKLRHAVKVLKEEGGSSEKIEGL